jgi:DNA mismatch endonuclease, patch repair protein
MDAVSASVRSEIMRKVGRINTKPEIAVRKALHALGRRFRLHRSDLPGTPDIVLPKYRMVIFVHGCFWHRHAKCRKATTPQDNYEYWQRKFDSNRVRDRRNKRDLAKMGWRCFVVWECQTKDRPGLEAALLAILQFSTSLNDGK